MHFRPYSATDYDVCVALFDSNVPKFFAPHEREEFTTFLRELPCPYFVITDDNGTVLACGGIGERDGSGGLAWGMVRRDQHRRGVGRLLLQKRIEWFQTEYPHIRDLRMDTSQHSVAFFERQGFRAYKIIMHGFAPGLHQYLLLLTW